MDGEWPEIQPDRRPLRGRIVKGLPPDPDVRRIHIVPNRPEEKPAMPIRSMPSTKHGAGPLILALCALLASPAHSVVSTASIGVAWDFGDGIEYAPYEHATEYSALDPTLEFGLVFGQKHRVSIQYMLTTYSDGIILPRLRVASSKFSAIYGYRFIPGVFIGPHCFLKFGSNEYEPYESGILSGSDHRGSLRDEYTYLGGGATLQMELLKHFAIQFYTDVNLPLEHSRADNVQKRMPESSSWQSAALPSGKSSYLNMGVIFSAKF